MIYVNDGYRVREGVVIPRGYYEDDAAELHGLRDYLLENHHARKATPGDIEAAQAEAEPLLSFDDFDGNLVKMHQGYRVGPGHIIEPGLYRPDDPHLAGKADYLVDNHFATWMEREVPAEPEESEATEYIKWTVSELKAEAARRGIEVPSGLVKPAIIALLQEDDAKAADEE